MAVPLPSAKITLTYPLYAADFDPRDSTRLVVAGGGGAGRSGVGNKITVIGTSNPYELEQITEIDLSKDEDNVTSLAVGQSKGKATLMYAGVNSSVKDVAKGRNEHFRVFGLEGPTASKKDTTSKILELARSTLFAGQDKDAYQRCLRLSRPYLSLGGPQLGAVATGLASQLSEIVLFDTSSSNTVTPNIRGRVQTAKEPNDIDVIQTGKDSYLFSWCTDKELWVKRISPEDADSEPVCVYTIPGPDSPGNPPVQSFRSLRFLTSEFVFLLTNLTGRKGVVLQVIRLNGVEPARIALQKRLPAKVLQSTGLSVRNLSPPASPEQKVGKSQFVIAVANHDTSISLYTMDYSSEMTISIVSNLQARQTLKDVHPMQITGIALSNFEPPSSGTAKQALKLASVSVGNTAVVHTIPLVSLKEASKTRYIVDIPTPPTSSTSLIILTLLTILVAIGVQGYLEVRDQSPSYLGAKRIISPKWQILLKPIPGQTGAFEDIYNWVLPQDPSTTTGIFVSTNTAPTSTPAASSLSSTLSELISSRRDISDDIPIQPVIYIRAEPAAEGRETNPELMTAIKADFHDEDVHGPHEGKTWEELGETEKKWWRTKLADAGHAVEDFGETLLKAVVFGEMGAAVREAVAGA